MKKLIKMHKALIKQVTNKFNLSDYELYWIAFFEGGLTIWIIDRVIFH